jgi:L-2-hydroxyglutarate oxidase LhgO
MCYTDGYAGGGAGDATRIRRSEADDVYDVVIIGGGIVGLSVAWQTLTRSPGTKLVVLEAEDAIGLHQTSHNSGVVHAGVYYSPGSQKAALCVLGKRMLEDFCARAGIPLEHNGKLVVATRESELDALARLFERGRRNGVPLLRRLEGGELRQVEPRVAGIAAVHSPRTGVVDFKRVATALHDEVREMGGSILLGWAAEEVRQVAGEVEVRSRGREPIRARAGVACAGLQADRVAGRAPGDDIRIVPFRGSWYVLDESIASGVRGSIYPVPDPSLPFLGVHLTRRIDGQVWAGPNAFLAFSRDGYRRWAFRPRDAWASLTYPGTWRLARRHLRTAWAELSDDLFASSYAKEVAGYLPGVTASHLKRGPMGIRAQAVDAAGEMLDDFVIRGDGAMMHVLNAPSPAATSSLAIGDTVARALTEKLGR